MKKGVSVLGSTGSVGTTTLEVLRRLSSTYRVVGLAAGRRVELLEEQINEFKPLVVSVGLEKDAARLKKKFPKVEVMHGRSGAVEVAGVGEADVVVAAIVGGEGLAPTYRAVSAGKRVALANKEALVMAGRIMMAAAKRSGAELLPVDSEHCAIFQCLQGERLDRVRRIILTASGGALRDRPLKRLASAKVEEVLEHPTWKMGAKITVDSATMVNKGLEIIEAHHLFGLPLDKIDVMIHPQSIVHSMVEFQDGSVICQMATPDMALPVQYAITYPLRVRREDSLDLANLAPLTFSAPDPKRFPCLGLFRRAANASEAHVVALNAANEVAVNAFLKGGIGFGGIRSMLEDAVSSCEHGRFTDIEEVFEADHEARDRARAFLRDATAGTGLVKRGKRVKK